MKTTDNSWLNVLIFSPHLDVGGGVVNFIQDLTRHLSSDIKVDQFIIGRRSGILRQVLRVLVPLFDAVRLARLLSVRRHDVYHINPSFDSRAVLRDGLFLLILRAYRRRKILVFFHGWDDDHYRQIASNPIWRTLFRLLYRQATNVLVLASSFARKLELLGLAPDRISVFTTMFDGSSIQRASRIRNDQNIWVLFLARFVVGKGIYELLDAFEAVSHIHSEATLILAGDGPESQRAQQWCKSHELDHRVRFPGYIDRTEKVQLLVDADVFVLPSHGEGCPVSLLEAMGAGLPVIVTPVGGIPDIVRDGVNGIVLKSPDSSLIVEALCRLIGDPDLRSKMAMRNRVEAWQKYEAQIITTKIENIYRKIAQN